MFGQHRGSRLRSRSLWAIILVAALGLTIAAVASPASTSAQVPVGATSAALQLPASKYVPVIPTRVMDSRPDRPTNGGFARLAPNQALSIDPIGGTPVEQQLADAGIAVDDVTAVIVNVTMVRAGQRGHATVWATGFGRPRASTNNATFVDQNVPNTVIAPVGLDGKISIFSNNEADYIIDVMGVMVESGATADGRFQQLGPIRHSDTRSPQLHTPGQQRYTTGEVRTVDLTPVGVPTSATGVVLNVTSARSDVRSFVRVWPAGVRPIPTHSNVNISTPGRAASSQVITGVTNGRIEVFTKDAMDLIIDVAGYFTGPTDVVATDGLFVPMLPERLLNTRDLAAPIGPTAGERVPAGAVQTVGVAGRAGIPPTGVTAAAFNLTVAEPAAPGHATAYPSAPQPPRTSSVNYTTAGMVLANHAVTSLSADGEIDIFTLAQAHLILDVTGYFIDGTNGIPTGSTLDKTIEPGSFDPNRLDGSLRPAAAPYDFLFDRAEARFGGRPSPSLKVAWSACLPIRYALNVDLADDAQIEILIDSIEEVEFRTGIDFQFAGVTSAGQNISDDVILADSLGLPFKYLPPDDDGTGDVDVVIGYSNDVDTPELRFGVIGVGGSLRTAFDATNRARAARGFAIIDLPDLERGGDALEIEQLTATTTHELGHMVGLGHVDEGDDGLEPGAWTSTDLRSQLMYPALNTSQTGSDFSPGDQLGLWELYNTNEQPCSGALQLDQDLDLVDVGMILDTAHDDHEDDH